MEEATRGIYDAVNPDLVLLFLIRNDKMFLQSDCLTESNYSEIEIPVHKVGECLCGLAARDAKPIYSINIHDDPRCTWKECKELGMLSFAAFPLIRGEEILGVVGLASEKERDFSDQAAFLEALINEISIAVHNALLFRRRKEHKPQVEGKSGNIQ